MLQNGDILSKKSWGRWVTPLGLGNSFYCFGHAISIRDWTHVPCIGSMESQPLDCQGSFCAILKNTTSQRNQRTHFHQLLIEGNQKINQGAQLLRPSKQLALCYKKYLWLRILTIKGLKTANSLSKKGFVIILERKVGLRTKDLKTMDIKPKAYLGE